MTMENLSLKLNSYLFFILLLTFLMGLSFFVYRRINPPVSGRLKRFLTLLRIASLGIILFILFEPILNLSWHRVEKPIIGVLLDTSASMSLTDEGKLRSEQAKKILLSNIFQTTGKDKTLEFYQFSDQLAALPLNRLDSVQFNHDGTDLTGALITLKEKNIDRYLKGVILITDGINNLGENPARYVEDYGTPIFPIAVGKPVAQKDFVITKVTTNQVTYANTRVPVDVSIQSFGFQGQRIKISLLKGSEVIDSKDINIEKDNFETRTRLEFMPGEPGFQKYRIQIPALKDELTAINNQKSFYVKVLKSKMKILFMAGSPDPDFKFMKKNLEADPNIEIDYWVVKKNQEFYQGYFQYDLNQLKQYDCLILQNFPGRNVAPQVIPILKNLIETYSTPLLFVAGNGMQSQSLLPLKDFLPITLPLNEMNEILVIPRLTAKGLAHPVTRIVDNEFENQQQWQDLPPIYFNLQRIQLYPGSETLVEIDPEHTLIRGQQLPLPLVVIKKMGQHKTIAILGYGIWRWDLLSWGIGRSSEIFKQFLSNSVRWLITKEDNKPVRIYPDQEIYRNGQPITFTGEVYYEDYRPRDGAEIKLKVHGKQKTYEILLAGIGNGKYEGALPAIEGGDYSYEGNATYHNRHLGTDHGQFSVEDFNLEFLQTKMNETLLQQMALKTGGTYLTDSSFSSLESLMQFPPRKKLESRELQLWNKLFWLIAAIIFLSSEWFLRKQSGML